jgi:pimeloyl-ACP methyl ester carboxylesterase
MQSNRWEMKVQHQLWVGSLFLVFGMAFSALGGHAHVPVALNCPNDLFLRGSFDANEGAEELDRLRRANALLYAKLHQGPFSSEDLYALTLDGLPLVSDVEGPVMDPKNSQQTVPYRQINLPIAKTGFYFPVAKRGAPYDLKLFDGVIIAMPGIGFSVSVAKSLFEIAGTFNNGKNEALRISDQKKLRMLTIPLDPPLNGLGSEAPYRFGHPDAVMEVVRHAHLVLQTLVPGKPFFVIGRSQGGLNALEYAARYHVMGAIALNPSSPDPEILRITIKEHEDMTLPENEARAKESGFDTRFHTLSWTAHHDFTPAYTMGSRQSLSPSLVQFGTDDWGYPQHLYRPYWEKWSTHQPDDRELRDYNGGHNLWMRPRGEKEELFTQVVGDMARFMWQRMTENHTELRAP